jgi:cytochrome c-type biogenesis protein CcmH/NrfF
MRLFLWILAALLAFSSGVHAEENPGWAYELADEIMSPYCPGRALSECPSGNADAMRRWIIEQEKAGVPRTEVEEALFARFGDQLLQAPKAEGVGIVAYAVPGVAFLLGGIAVVVFLARRRTSDTDRLPPEDLDADRLAPEDLEAARELDEELRG